MDPIMYMSALFNGIVIGAIVFFGIVYALIKAEERSLQKQIDADQAEFEAIQDALDLANLK